MKVLFTTNLPSPYRVEFFSELGRLCDLTVVYERHSASDRDSSWSAKVEKTYKEVFLKGKSIGTDNSFCPGVLAMLNKNYDVIVIGVYSTFTSMIAIAYMRLRGMRFLISTDGGFVKEESASKFRLKKFLISGAFAWLSTGKKTDEYLVHYGAKRERIYTYPFTSLSEKDILNGPLSYDEKIDLRSHLKILTGGVQCISVGQFIPRKGFDVLVCVAEKYLPEVKFLIIGGKQSDIEQMIDHKLPDNVTTIDFMGKQELFEYYKAADLFVLPTREDVWGLVVNEAMACGLPVVTTNNCIAGLELVEDGVNGFLVDVNDPEGLAAGISKFTDSQQCIEFGKNALSRVKGYTYKKMAERHYQIFMDLFEKK